MQRRDLEHLIRAAAAITNEYEMVVIGSQAILGAVPDAPEVLLRSMEADMYPLNRPDLADLIEGSIGELSLFHEKFGYYAQGVGPETAVLPSGWKERVVKIQNDNTDLKIGYCLDPNDLAASKLAAGRDKDWEFVAAMLEHCLVCNDTLSERVASLDVTPERRAQIESWMESRASWPAPAC